ncbi:MAG: PIN domain-containing protein [Candidatus Bipolaricaulota bacterium]
MLSLDVSVVIYHLEGLAPYASLTEIVFTDLARGAIAAVIPTICVTELLVKPLADRADDKVRSCEAFLDGLPNTQFVPPTVSIAKEAARLRAVHRLRTPDALLIATALAEKATAFLTNDARMKRVEEEGITVLVLRDYIAS